MAQASDIGWGSYKNFEGPYYAGKCPFIPPEYLWEDHKILAVFAATEGGRWDGYNGYDSCICTSGLAQWCERGQYSVSDMLGEASQAKNGELLHPLRRHTEPLGIGFYKNKKGRHRFFFGDDEVDTEEEQQRLFLRNSNGQKGTWDDESKQYAKEFAAAISSVWEQPEAQEIQLEYTVRKMHLFAYKESKDILEEAKKHDSNNIGQAFTAAYLSFAGNNPLRAYTHLMRAMESWYKPVWTHIWLIHVLKELTFGPKVAIYPHRYNAIRPVLEKHYNMDLPDFAEELEHWKGSKWVLAPQELQMGLIALGYDLGPAGADGKVGKKTKDAILTFERLHGLPDPDGLPDVGMVMRLEQELEKRGYELLKSS